MAAEAFISDPGVLTFQLEAQVQKQNIRFLVDSGSTHSFLNSKFVYQFSDVVELPNQLRVKIADGATLVCTQGVTACPWQCDGHEFQSQFRFLSLGVYDGILGLDCLVTHGPMYVDWDERWMSFSHQGLTVTLHSKTPSQCACKMVEICLLQAEKGKPETYTPEIQQLLETFSSVFAEPTGLPPRRPYDYTIPLVERAQPISRRPYRYTPQLKNEIERQIEEMLASGVIQHSTSAFPSPIIMVHKKDATWRLVTDFR